MSMSSDRGLGGSPSSDGGPPRILCIDDSPTVRARLALELSAHAEVETAASWAEALPLVLKSRPGLILVDLDIPGFPGTDVVRFLKRSLSQKVKVALLSSADLATLEQARHDSGADAALQKSFDAAMVRAVRALLPKARPVIG